MRSTDVAVVGAGPAGIGAALAAARGGASVIVVDEQLAPGGHLRWTMSRQSGFGELLDGLRGDQIAEWALGAFDDAGVKLLSSSVAWGLFDDNTLGVTSADDSFQLRSEITIIATGATDLVWPCPGWELPGVITATAALRFMHLDRVLPGRRVAVLGAGSVSAEVAADLESCGATVVVKYPTLDGLKVGGSGMVEWIESHGERTACDTVVHALGRQPDAQLALQAQVGITFSKSDGVFVAARDISLMTSVKGIYVVGDAARVGTPTQAYAEGTVAGIAATGGAGLDEALDRLSGIASSAVSFPAMPEIGDDTIVCRCEEVRGGTIREAIAGGAVSLNDLKRRTRAGMGICQGIFCNRAMAGLISAEAGVAIESIVPMTARPPARLVPMATIADLEV